MVIGNSLWESIKNEDSNESFTLLFNSLWKSLYTKAMWKVGNEDIAKDIVQEVFINLWNKRKEIRINDNLEAYLNRAIQNKVIDYFRSNINKIATVTSNEYNENIRSGLNADDRLRQKEVDRIYDEAVSLLPEQMRYIFELSRDCQYSIDEIAKELDISTQTVKNQLSNAKKRLRTFLISKIEKTEVDGNQYIMIFLYLSVFNNMQSIVLLDV